MSNSNIEPGVLRDEFIGTFVLALVVKATAVAAVLHKTIAGQPPDSSSVFLAIGITLVALVLYNGSCHYNPGLTLGAAIAGQISWSEVLPRSACQLGGAISSSLVTWFIYGSAGRNDAHLGASLPVPDFSLTQVLFVEFLGAMLFYIITLRLAGNSTASNIAKAVGIGFGLGVMVLVAGPISGGAINPAIGFAPLFVSLTLTGWQIYVFAPLVSGLVAGLFSRKQTSRNSSLPSSSYKSATR